VVIEKLTIKGGEGGEESVMNKKEKEKSKKKFKKGK